MLPFFVDDSLETAEALAGLPTLMGHDATFSNTCDDAFTLAIRIRPDIVFADIRPGRQGGRELYRRLRPVPTLAGPRYMA